jgi:hypothetical protein
MQAFSGIDLGWIGDKSVPITLAPEYKLATGESLAKNLRVVRSQIVTIYCPSSYSRSAQHLILLGVLTNACADVDYLLRVVINI